MDSALRPWQAAESHLQSEVTSNVNPWAEGVTMRIEARAKEVVLR